MVIDMDGVRVVFPDEMGQKEALGYLREQLTLKPALRLSRLDIVIDGAEAVLCPHYDTVRRVRRVTGYLSEMIVKQLKTGTSLLPIFRITLLSLVAMQSALLLPSPCATKNILAMLYPFSSCLTIVISRRRRRMRYGRGSGMCKG